MPPPPVLARIRLRLPLQQFAFEFVVSVPRLSASSTDRALVFPFNGIIECANSLTPTLNLWVVQPCYPQNSRVLRGYTWEIWFETGKLETIQANDSGPAFTEAALTEVTVCPASIPDDGGFSYNRSTHFWTHKVRCQLPDHGATVYEVSSVNCALVVVICKFVFSRRFSRREWNRLSCERVPAPKSSLLDSAARTGDVILQGGEGVEITAHSAVLVDVPFFEAKLREEWSGTTAWNLHNKLRLRLPCDVSKDALDVFLCYLYGDTQLLYGIDPGASLLKEILSLADACGVPALCNDVIGLVMVTSANVAQWLPWLLQEHGSINVEPIQKQVGEIMRNQLQTALQAQTLTVEQLAVISMSLAHPEGLLPPSAPTESVANPAQNRAQSDLGN